MNKLVIANLKNFLDDYNVKNYIKNIKNIKNIDYDNLIVFPQDKYIDLFISNNYKVGVQDLSESYNKVNYILLGHYDKRKNGESNDLINDKIKLSLEKNLKIILCVGNNKDDDYKYIYNQIDSCLKDISNDRLNNIILAYEPFYMIGNDLTIDIKVINDYINNIKNYVKNNYNIDIKVLYGGNVNNSNVSEIMKICDGIMIGRASFDIKKITQILQKI